MSSGTNIYNDNPSPIAVGRIKFDISQIRNDKDIIANEGIYYCFDTENNISTHYHQLIIGPEDSPYHGGFYLFKAQFPDNYPFKPMTMKTLTQGEKVRKHPNLYVCGKCCFSFLGTWQGPPWTPCNNPRSVGVSMRSVMTPFPLENEPGYEDIKKRQSLHTRYADLISWFNIKHAVCEVMENIDNEDMSYKLFKNDIIYQFNKNFNYYISYTKKLLKYEEDLIKNYGNSYVKSPVYGFSIEYNVKSTISKLEILYSKYSNFDSLNPKVVENKCAESQPKSDEIQVNNVVDKPKENKPKSKKTKKTPNESASKFEIGYKMISQNDKCMYEVYQTKGTTLQKRWKKCK